MKSKRKLANGRSSRWALWDVFRVPDYDTEGDYLTRIRIVQTPVFGIYLHRFDGPDPRPTLHDHPWAFTSIVLRGGYVERRLDPHTMKVEENAVVRFYNRKHPHNAHAIIRLLRVPTWTLFLVGRRQRTWGYWEPLSDLEPGTAGDEWVFTEFNKHEHAWEFDEALARRKQTQRFSRAFLGKCPAPDGECTCDNGIGCVNVSIEAW